LPRSRLRGDTTFQRFAPFRMAVSSLAYTCTFFC
jgi:hypothetical protein